MTTILKTGTGFTVHEGANREEFIFERGKCDFGANGRGELEFTASGLRKLQALGIWTLELVNGKIKAPPPKASDFFAADKITKPAPPPPPASAAAIVGRSRR